MTKMGQPGVGQSRWLAVWGDFCEAKTQCAAPARIRHRCDLRPRPRSWNNGTSWVPGTSPEGCLTLGFFYSDAVKRYRCVIAARLKRLSSVFWSRHATNSHAL